MILARFVAYFGALLAVSAEVRDASFERDFALSPINKQNSPVWMVLMPGAQVPPSHYASFARSLQQQASDNHNLSLWIAIPSFATLLDVGIIPSMVRTAVQRVHTKLVANGLPSNAPFVMGGHSVGAVATQEYVMSGHSDVIMPNAAFFLGASLLRKYNGTLDAPQNKFPLPWVTLSGELDGLQRPTRVAQGFYHYVMREKLSHDPAVDSAVLIIEGMNHMQVASDGRKLPLLPKKLDLHPELTNAQAHLETGKYLLAFVAYHFGSRDDQAQHRETLSTGLDQTREFFNPILEALYQESNVYLKKPCNSDNPSPHCPYYPFWPPQPQNTPPRPSQDTDCWCETPWAKVAVRQMVDADGLVEVVSTDSIHDVRDTKPFHHAHVWNNCSSKILNPQFRVQQSDSGSESMQNELCKFNVTTVSESVYDKYEELDTGFTHATAAEIRVKMKSRQLYRQNTIDPFAPFEVDNVNVCKEVNQLAYQWAINKASEKARQRFLKHGTPLKFLDDYHFPIAIGPLWINTRLRLKEKLNDQGELEFTVQSIAMKTELDSWINKLHPDSGGQHYCKLLSPARVMEWIYTDGLRNKLGYAH